MKIKMTILVCALITQYFAKTESYSLIKMGNTMEIN